MSSCFIRRFHIRGFHDNKSAVIKKLLCFRIQLISVRDNEYENVMIIDVLAIMNGYS